MKKELSFAGWVIILGLLYLFSKTTVGYKIIYYSLVLILVLLLIGQYKQIQEIMYVQEEK